MTMESPYASRLATIPVREGRESVLGSDTHYWDYGPEDAQHTIVIAHGYRGEHHGFEPVIAHLPEYRFIGADMPGFGESSPLTLVPHSIEGYAKWLTAFIEQLGLTGKAIVLGHSFGSIIGSRAVADGLDTPAFIMVNPISVPGTEGPRRVATAATIGFYRVGGRLPRPVAKRFLGNWVIVQFMSSNLAKTKDRALRRWVHYQHHTYFNRFSDRDTVVEAFDASMSHDVSDFADELHVPVLLVAAELDDITPVAAHYVLQRTIPDASLTVLDGVGHLIHYEAPDRAAAAIRDFVDALPPKRV
ncbi:MAG TPA: alpha/beta hydrolase [Terrimesophilobacter sp.]|nr:alpha/beta hydrolase [Terrimesophilobacter sp.]HRQ00567.1 alpha/beta hydrolase [Terrimesophilobacter sp.]